MNKRFVVAILFFDNVISQYIVDASDWRAALEKAKPGTIENLPSDCSMEDAMQEAFNQDWNFHVIEV